MVANFGAKSFSDFGIIPRQFISATCNSQSLRSNSYSTSRQCFHGKFKSKSVLSYPVCLRHFHILKHYRMGIGTTNSHFIFFPSYGNTFPISFNNKGINAPVACFYI